MSGTVRSGSTRSAIAASDLARLSILTWSLLAVGVLLLISGCTPAPTAPAFQRNPDPAGYAGGSSLPKPYVMPEVSLTDTSGRPYNLATTPSKPVTLLFFGYTHCPDVCIAVLSDVSLALQRLTPADQDQIQLIFITTDPARDKEKRIRHYLDRFSPTFVGLTGPMSTIKRAAGEVGVEIEGLKKLPSGGYEVGHSAQVIGFSRNSGVVIWTPGTPIGALKQDFALLVERSR
ncbi:MAG TPA: SCO family protein [Propionibacteriaceae bacterium]|nr:SCO family protein [Propionibacteriaceae bacterium]